MRPTEPGPFVIDMEEDEYVIMQLMCSIVIGATSKRAVLSNRNLVYTYTLGGRVCGRAELGMHSS